MFLVIFLFIAQVKINEVFYNPLNPSGPHERFGEWIELYNAGNETFDLSGYIISDENDWDSITLDEGYFYIPDGTVLEPGNFLLLVHDADTFSLLFGEPPPNVLVIQYGPNPVFVMNNSGDDLHLFSPGGEEVDMLYWGNGGDMEPISPAPQVEDGHSIGRFPDGNDSDDPGIDFNDYEEPSPGEENPNPSSVVERKFTPLIRRVRKNALVLDISGRVIGRGKLGRVRKWGIYILIDKRGKVRKILGTPEGEIFLESFHK